MIILSSSCVDVVVIDGYSRTRSGLEASSVIPGRAALSPEDAELFADAVKKVAPSSIESLEPYKADIFGLEKASSYCKCALMQIAREVLSVCPVKIFALTGP